MTAYDDCAETDIALMRMRMLWKDSIIANTLDGNRRDVFALAYSDEKIHIFHYEIKDAIIDDLLCRGFTAWYGREDSATKGYSHVLYIHIPSFGIVSFHMSWKNPEIQNWPGWEWDGRRNSWNILESYYFYQKPPAGDNTVEPSPEILELK